MHTRNRLLVLALGCLAAAASYAGEQSLRIYCVYHARHGFRAISRDCRERAGVSLQLPPHCRDHFTPSADALKTGDLYVTTSPDDMATAKEKGLLASEPRRIGRVAPVIAVMKGNPHKIRSLDDLARESLVVAYPSTCIGKVALAIVQKNGLNDTVKPNMTVRTGNRTGVLKPLVQGQAHAAITWRCAIIESGRKNVDAVPIPAEKNVIEPILIAVLKSRSNAARARGFLDYLGTEPARRILAAHGLAED
jgi:ABC-type molybdate transport system substrate-binding protein